MKDWKINFCCAKKFIYATFMYNERIYDISAKFRKGTSPSI